jgi:hypothetical protein
MAFPELISKLRSLCAETMILETSEEAREGLSPEQIMVMCDNKLGKNYIKLKDGNAGEAAPFVRQAAYYLTIIKAQGEIKQTQAGYLPPKIVEDIYTQKIIVDPSNEMINDFKTEKGRKIKFSELDYKTITQTKIICDLAGLTKKLHNKITLTKKGEKALQSASLFRPLFSAYCDKFNWAYFHGFDDEDVVHICYPYTFYLLQKYGNKEKPIEFYAIKSRHANYPNVDFGEETDMKFDHLYEWRMFGDFLARFGFVEIIEKPIKSEKYMKQRYVKRTRLFTDCVSVVIE